MNDKLDKIEQNQNFIIDQLIKLRTKDHTDMMTSSEVMEFLKISRPTFNRYKNEGLFKVYKMNGGKLLCKKGDILDALENGLFTTPS